MMMVNKPRDPERLDTFYDTLKKYHKKYFPDLRVGQFILNFSSYYFKKYNTDFYYKEDDDLMEEITLFIKEMMERNNILLC